MKVLASDVEQYDPARYAFRWNADYTEAEVITLPWWDDASYAAYQGDREANDDPMTPGEIAADRAANANIIAPWQEAK